MALINNTISTLNRLRDFLRTPERFGAWNEHWRSQPVRENFSCPLCGNAEAAEMFNEDTTYQNCLVMGCVNCGQGQLIEWYKQTPESAWGYRPVFLFQFYPTTDMVTSVRLWQEKITTFEDDGRNIDRMSRLRLTMSNNFPLSQRSGFWPSAHRVTLGLRKVMDIPLRGDNDTSSVVGNESFTFVVNRNVGLGEFIVDYRERSGNPMSALATSVIVEAREEILPLIRDYFAMISPHNPTLMQAISRLHDALRQCGTTLHDVTGAITTLTAEVRQFGVHNPMTSPDRSSSLVRPIPNLPVGVTYITTGRNGHRVFVASTRRAMNEINTSYLNNGDRCTVSTVGRMYTYNQGRWDAASVTPNNLTAAADPQDDMIMETYQAQVGRSMANRIGGMTMGIDPARSEDLIPPITSTPEQVVSSFLAGGDYRIVPSTYVPRGRSYAMGDTIMINPDDVETLRAAMQRQGVSGVEMAQPTPAEGLARPAVPNVVGRNSGPSPEPASPPRVESTGPGRAKRNINI